MSVFAHILLSVVQSIVLLNPNPTSVEVTAAPAESGWDPVIHVQDPDPLTDIYRIRVTGLKDGEITSVDLFGSQGRGLNFDGTDSDFRVPIGFDAVEQTIDVLVETHRGYWLVWAGREKVEVSYPYSPA